MLGFGVALAVIFMFTPAYGNGKDLPTEGFILMTLCTGFLVIGLLLGFAFFNRKSDITLVRWTKTSFVILASMVFVGMILTSVLIVNQSDNKELDSGAFVIGSQGYSEDVELDVQKLLNLTNEARIDNRKSPLEMSEELNTSALNKCKDMVADNYWSHEDKDGVEPWHFITETGYKYSNSGENLAYGYINEAAIVDGWMNSEGHRANLLGSYTQVGFATCKAENYMNQGKQIVVVQHFATPYSTSTQSGQQSQNVPASTYNYEPYVAPVCTKTVIPYETIYIDADYLYVGDTMETGLGIDGYTETCTASSSGYKPPDYTSQPFDKTVYRGTKPLQSTSSSLTTPNYSQCSQFIGTGAYQACIDALN